MFNSLVLGLKRHPWRFLASVFLTYSALWTLVESIAYFNPDINLQGTAFQYIAIAISVLVGAFRAYQPRKIVIRGKMSDTTLRIYFGDLFEEKGFVAIQVNEYFDSVIGRPVSPQSLHGILINKFFGGHPEAFDNLIEQALSTEEYEVVARQLGRTKKYPIGTTAHIRANHRDFLLVALCHTDIETFKANADIPQLWSAVEGLLAAARNCTDGHSLSLPLLGSGLAGLGLPPTQILQLIVLAIINRTKKMHICKEINIVLHEDRFDEIDLETIKKQWG